MIALVLGISCLNVQSNFYFFQPSLSKKYVKEYKNYLLQRSKMQNLIKTFNIWLRMIKGKTFPISLSQTTQIATPKTAAKNTIG